MKITQHPEPPTSVKLASSLLLCKEFIEKHGSKICVEREEGTGITFGFEIPVKQ